MEKRRFVKKRRVVVFGIFDGVHEGHRFLFEQALRLAGARSGQASTDIELIAIVGRDEFVRAFKHKEPKNEEHIRVETVQKEPLVDRAVLGDEVPSSWRVLELLRPDIICLGYDQDALEEDLRRWMVKTRIQIPVYRLKRLER